MIALGCDTAGFELMQAVKGRLDERGLCYIDFGTHDGGNACDYPQYAKLVAEAVAEAVAEGKAKAERGIVICGTGIGMAIAANRYAGVRCALCHDAFTALQCREHNDANVLAMGARVVSSELALEMLDIWLDTDFSKEERHGRRVKQIEIT